MTSFHPRVTMPCELIDEILDILISSAVSVSEASSVALASRRCRHRVYSQCFSRIRIHSQRPNHLKRLARLLACNIWPSQDALHHYIRSITLVLGKPRTRIWEIEHDNKKYEALITIFRSIFRNPAEANPGTFSLTIATESPADLGDMWGLQFDTTLGLSVVSALHDLCHKSCITELHLHDVWNVPPSLLYTSRIRHLHLVNVHFNEQLACNSDLPSGNIKNMSVKNSPFFSSPSSLVEATQNWHYQYSLQLKPEKLQIWVNRGQFKRLSKLCAQMDTLVIHVFPFVYAYPGAVDYSNLQVLQSIEINQEMTMCCRVPDDSDNDTDGLILLPNTPIFLSIFNMLPPVLPPVLHVNMKITIDWYDTFAISREALDELYSRLYHPSLLNGLQQNSIDGNRTAEFDLEIAIALKLHVMDEEPGCRKEEYEEYMHQLLRSLTSIRGVSLSMRVDVY